MNWGQVATSSSEKTWTQPALSANGTWDGNDFAVKASHEASKGQAWHAVDGSESTGWSSYGGSLPVYYYFYYPTKLKWSSIEIMNHNSNSVGSIASLQIHGSDDDTNYESLTSYQNSLYKNKELWTVPVNSSKFYKYYRITITAGKAKGSGYSSMPGVQEFNINATYQTTVANSITFPYTHHSTDSYSPWIFLYGGDGECYVSSRLNTGLILHNTSSATSCLYGTIGY